MPIVGMLQPRCISPRIAAAKLAASELTAGDNGRQGHHASVFEKQVYAGIPLLCRASAGERVKCCIASIPGHRTKWGLEYECAGQLHTCCPYYDLGHVPSTPSRMRGRLRRVLVDHLLHHTAPRFNCTSACLASCADSKHQVLTLLKQPTLMFPFM